MPRLAAALALAVFFIGCGDQEGTHEQPAVRAAATAPAPALPAPHAAIPTGPKRLAARVARVSSALRTAIDRWRAAKPGRRARPPRAITLLALYQQRVDRLLARRPRLLAATARRLPPRVRAEVRDSAGALRSLFRLTSLATEHRFRVGPPQPPDLLLGYDKAAQRRFGVSWRVLAAINLVETNFDRLRNVSSAGAVGPMQFMPATWRAYGLGGDIHDPHDAIVGAANYLRAAGAPAHYARAIYAYNPSPLYVDAILRFAHRMRRDPRAFYAYWSWQSFRRTGHGDVQLTGPGAG